MISAFIDLFIHVLKVALTLYRVKRTPGSLRCLTGKTAIVTGGNSGIGFAVATKLASRGCKVIIADCQNAELSRDKIIAATDNKNIVYKHLDLSSFKSVRSFATDICKTEEKIDILMNNAGIGLTEKTVSEDGLSYLMQVNIFGAILLTHLLLDPLKKSGSARVFFTSSIAIWTNSLTLKRLNPTNYKMNDEYRVSLYSNSKMCSVLAAQELGERWKNYGITVNSIDPVAANTNIHHNLAQLTNGIRIVLKVALFIFALDADEIATSYLNLITENGTKIQTGENYVLSEIYKKPKILNDKNFCAEIWSKLEELIQLKPEDKKNS